MIFSGRYFLKLVQVILTWSQAENSNSASMAPGPAAPVSPRNLLETQLQVPTAELWNEKLWKRAPAIWVLTSFQELRCMRTLANDRVRSQAKGMSCACVVQFHVPAT